MHEVSLLDSAALPCEEQLRRIEKIRRELGPVILDLLSDPTVIEIMVNADHRLWVERLGEPMTPVGVIQATRVETLIYSVAAYHRTVIHEDKPVIECELPGYGARFEGMIPPVVEQALFTIRCRASRVFTLQEYEAAGILKPSDKTRIEAAIEARQNILVVGGTGSGKTTFLNALVAEIVRCHPDHRLVILEDTAEIQCSAQNAVMLHTTEQMDLLKLLKATLRLRPDRILVGEVRGSEALALLKAWNTGHPGGVATIHANDAEAGLIRMEQLIAEATSSPMQSLIGEAVDLIIFINKTRTGRVIQNIKTVQGYHRDHGYLVS